MIKSPVNKFDLFPLSRLIEVSVQDGDNIVKLEEYADRILQFKKNKMHLINVSQELEFLEDTFVHKGVSHPAATCKTDFGIAWVNKLGCYLYDGQKVTNLLEKGGRQIIKESDWSSFITDNSAIGYIPKKRQLLIIDSVDSQYSSGNRYLYDMVTQSWVKSEKTNIIANPSFELAGGSPFLNWTEANGSGPAIWYRDSGQQHAGTYNAKCVNHANQTSSASITSDAFNLTPGKTYTLSWWGRFNLDPDPTMRLTNTIQSTHLHDDMSFGILTYPDWDLFGDADTVNTWHYYSLTFSAPSEYTGTHTGSANQDGSASNPLIDSSLEFPDDSLIGATITNTTSDKGGFATITDNTNSSNQIVHSTALTGGNDWDNGDTYTITNLYSASDNYELALYPTTTDDCHTWIDDISLIEEGNSNMTNFVTDWNGDLVYAVAPGNVFKWNDTSNASNSFSLKTKDIDFGQPSVRKKIYRVYVTYKSGATTNVQVDYDVDGGTSFTYDFANGTNFTSNELASASGWQVAELKPDTSSEANNIKSIRLRFGTDGTVPAGFEINDISIVYRLKNIK